MILTMMLSVRLFDTSFMLIDEEFRASQSEVSYIDKTRQNTDVRGQNTERPPPPSCPGPGGDRNTNRVCCVVGECLQLTWQFGHCSGLR